ncbi:ABC transporter permease subunit [Leifsonia soli]|uniref:Simple sugar transport system permease protein n=1 Tax=Leifsonia soli TaxID=582665 RepID=A0A852SV36_9MICO|nr:simple sugar transport system permease protein [Leifsonia soli]
MSTTAPAVPNSSPIVLEKAEIRSWKAPIAFGIFVLISIILFFGFSRHGESTFRFSEKSDAVRLPTLTVDSFATTTVVTVLLLALTLWSAYLSYRARRTPIWVVIVFSLLFMFAFLTWADSGSPYPVPVTGLLLGTISLAVPLVFGALGGVVSERGGVVNVAIEGQLLAGAFVSAMTATLTGSWAVGLIAAMVAGVLVSFLLGAFGIKYLVDQVIVGVVLNVLVIGLTSFLYSKVLAGNPQLLNHPPRLPSWPIPVLSEIPIIGKVLFDQSIIEYLMYLAVFLVWFGLFKTRWGLRLRSVGEHPEAADTVGIKVNSTRFWNVALAGAIAGLGGAYYTLGSVGAFSKEMTAGQGFIALAAVIFGRWDPIRATLAALLFGFATNLQNVLSTIGSPVPSEFMLMLPYVVTILAVAGLVGLSRAPAADGKPYIKS